MRCIHRLLKITKQQLLNSYEHKETEKTDLFFENFNLRNLITELKLRFANTSENTTKSSFIKYNKKMYKTRISENSASSGDSNQLT